MRLDVGKCMSAGLRQRVTEHKLAHHPKTKDGSLTVTVAIFKSTPLQSGLNRSTFCSDCMKICHNWKPPVQARGQVPYFLNSSILGPSELSLIY